MHCFVSVVLLDTATEPTLEWTRYPYGPQATTPGVSSPAFIIGSGANSSFHQSWYKKIIIKKNGIFHQHITIYLYTQIKQLFKSDAFQRSFGTLHTIEILFPLWITKSTLCLNSYIFFPPVLAKFLNFLAYYVSTILPEIQQV